MMATGAFDALICCFCDPYRHLFFYVCVVARRLNHLDVGDGVFGVSSPSSPWYHLPARPWQVIASV
jgi:hypothetical protein